MVVKYEYVGGDNQVVDINNPDMHYSYVYAPMATRIKVGSVDTIFCGPSTKVETPCNDIRRGEFYKKAGYIYNKIENKPEYKLTFTDMSFGSSGVQFQPLFEEDGLEQAREIMELEKNIAICTQKIAEGSPSPDEEDSEKVKKIKDTFDSVIKEMVSVGGIKRQK